MANRKRYIRKEINFDEQEEKKLRKKISESMCSSFSQYAREMLLNGKIEIKDYSSVRNLQNEVNRIGVNINQIAKIVNENRDIRETELKELQNSFLELTELIYDFYRIESGMRVRRKRKYPTKIT